MEDAYLCRKADFTPRNPAAGEGLCWHCGRPSGEHRPEYPLSDEENMGLHGFIRCPSAHAPVGPCDVCDSTGWVRACSGANEGEREAGRAYTETQVLYLMVSARVNSSFGPTHSEMTELLDLVEAHDDVWKQILDGRWNPCPCDGDTAPKGSLPCSPDHPCSYAKGALT